MTSQQRRRLDRLTSLTPLCPGCLDRERREAEEEVLAKQMLDDFNRFLANRTPERLREEARRLLAEADVRELQDSEDGVPGVGGFGSPIGT
jgi:hypothetical protein